MSATATETPGVPGPVVRLDAELETQVGVGRWTALFVCGSCVHRDAEIAELAPSERGIVGDELPWARSQLDGDRLTGRPTDLRESPESAQVVSPSHYLIQEYEPCTF